MRGQQLAGPTAVATSVLSTGILFGTVAGLTRGKYSFDSRTYVVVQQATIRALRPVMSVLLPASVLTNLLVLLRRAAGHGRPVPASMWLAVLGPLFTLVLTVRFELPVNTAVMTWDAEDAPPEWSDLRDRWERVHVVRTVTALVGLIGTLSAVYANDAIRDNDAGDAQIRTNDRRKLI